MNDEIPASSPWVVEAKGLTKTFGDRHALGGIDLRISRGEHLVIFRP